MNNNKNQHMYYFGGILGLFHEICFILYKYVYKYKVNKLSVIFSTLMGNFSNIKNNIYHFYPNEYKYFDKLIKTIKIVEKEKIQHNLN